MAFIPPLLAAASAAATSAIGAIGSVGGTLNAIGTTAASNVLGAVGATGASSSVAANGLVASLGGAGQILSAGGTLASGIAAKRAADFNAEMALLQGQQASEQGALAASEANRQTIQRLAAARAGATENGFALTGSVSDLLSQAGRQGQLDYLTAVYDGTVRNVGAKNSAALYKMQGRGALTESFLGAGSKLIGGMADVYRRRTVQLAN